MKDKAIASVFAILAVILYNYSIAEFVRGNTAEGVKVALFALTDSLMAYCFSRKEFL